VLTNFLNGFSFILVAIQIFKIIGSAQPLPEEFTFVPKERVVSIEPSVKPDIYYIVVDGYARSDVAKEIYKFDNSDFMNYLSDKGFYVAQKSTSNYCQTALSLASSLNCSYLDKLAIIKGINSNDHRPLFSLINKNRVFDFLRKRGYAIVAFSSSYVLTEMEEADIYLRPVTMPSLFQIELLNTTPIATLMKLVPSVSLYNLQRKQVFSTLEGLADFPLSNKPVFIFAHIVSPHAPFIFTHEGRLQQQDTNFTIADGSHLIRDMGLGREQYVRRYREQIIFMTEQIKRLINSILARAKRPLVVIIQSDHGPSSQLDLDNFEKTNLWEKMTILNAYYFSDKNYKDLYENISPVNTFRVVFNHYFAANLHLLKDSSFFSLWDRPYEFFDVTEKTQPR